MKNFMEKLTTDKEFKEKFISHMHSEEGKVKEASEKIGAELNKFMQESIESFCKEQGITCELDQETANKLCELCKGSALKLNEMLIDVFEKY